ncbi:rRNA cytosine-C5-methyltransferase [Dysgonomonas sp. 216]|uniref:methyltransferase RsmF C-terminal domain-like protein n=1 Tax=Dysgonomonas sp. 216 TaxID=2302934 RepID=UPI0013D45D52|nr:rRNA cytosine-C5-methyltransferase [Dysgonomonas sp. 216]NDW18027.1 rRNA cytosine-C5-methyltransferase [Dysgonomonas sp. 216]
MNLPPQFIERTKPLLGEEWDAFENALTEETPISIRLNSMKYNQPLKNNERVGWCHTGYYLPKRPKFTFDPLFHAGCYYPQEASSMFVEQAFRQCMANKDGLKVLDLCAAPGGKSTLLMSLLSDNSLLVSNEVIRSRANILSENITKWGKANNIVTNNDPSEIGKLTSFFDLILVDAPCSGEGMFRKDETALSEWSEANVQLCKERQQRIVADIWNALKPGGMLIYSTCTYNADENEDNVLWFCENLGASPIELAIVESWNITGALKGNLPVYRFLPHKTKGEGFFLAVIQKNADEEPTGNLKTKNKSKDRKGKKTQLDGIYKDYILNSANYAFFQENDNWKAIPEQFAAEYEMVSSMLRVVSGGVQLGTLKGKDFIPAHSLAMSSEINKETFPSYELDWKTAIAYLRKETIVLDHSAPKGYVLVCYMNVPLGFVKNIGNRANNLYPQEWRIRTSNIPDISEDVILRQ